MEAMSDVPLTEVAAEPTVLDIQHDTDPAQDHGIARRIPHLGHAILFFAIALMATVVCVVGAFAAAHLHSPEEMLERPGLALGSQALGYVVTLAAAAWVFPRLWGKSFLRGIEWNALAARRRWMWVVPVAVALSAAAQGTLHFLPTTPGQSPIEDMMRTAPGAWMLALFGVLLAPLTEEIAFRGFLLPALATAYDWLALDRTPAGLQRWQSSTGHSAAALLFGALFSSLPFALLHAGQVAHAWAVLGVLFVVSLALSYVRIVTHSVACSTLMHATYNCTIFAVLFIASGGFRHLDKLSR